MPGCLPASYLASQLVLHTHYQPTWTSAATLSVLPVCVVCQITSMRVEILGTGFTAQHSDARVLDQLLYKWSHSRKVRGPTTSQPAGGQTDKRDDRHTRYRRRSHQIVLVMMMRGPLLVMMMRRPGGSSGMVLTLFVRLYSSMSCVCWGGAGDWGGVDRRVPQGGGVGLGREPKGDPQGHPAAAGRGVRGVHVQEALSEHEEQQQQGTRRLRVAEAGKQASQMQVAIRPRRKRIGEERDRVRSALLGCCCFCGCRRLSLSPVMKVVAAAALPASETVLLPLV